MNVSSLCVILCAALLFVGCAQKGETPEQMVAAAKELDQRFLDAYNKGDVDGVMATYWNSPELVSFPPGAFGGRGWEDIKKGMTQEFAMTQGGKLEFIETNNRAEGSVVLGWGKWRWIAPTPEGTPMEMVGRYSDVKAKRDGKWVFVIDHASVPLPPPPTQTATP